MNKLHKHCEFIKAWADGAEIQAKDYGDSWYDIHNPGFYEDVEYRIKPRTVKREGWVVVYKYNDGTPYVNTKIFVSEYDAKYNCPMAKAIIKVEWTEELSDA